MRHLFLGFVICALALHSAKAQSAVACCHRLSYVSSGDLTTATGALHNSDGSPEYFNGSTIPFDLNFTLGTYFLYSNEENGYHAYINDNLNMLQYNTDSQVRFNFIIFWKII